MLSLSHENQFNIVKSLNSTYRYLDNILNIDNEYFERMVDTIYPEKNELNKTIPPISKTR